jgi:hypothetical protein
MMHSTWKSANGAAEKPLDRFAAPSTLNSRAPISRGMRQRTSSLQARYTVSRGARTRRDIRLVVIVAATRDRSKSFVPQKG